MLTRRHFLTASSAALATSLFAAPKDSKTPNPDLEKLGAVALAEAKKYQSHLRRHPHRPHQRPAHRPAPLARARHRQDARRAQCHRRFQLRLRRARDRQRRLGLRLVARRHPGRDRARHRRSRHHRQGQRHHPAQARATRARESLSRPLGDAARTRSVRRPDGRKARPAAPRLRRGQEGRQGLLQQRHPQPAQRGQVLRVHRGLLHPAAHPADLRQCRCHRRGSREQHHRARATTRPPRPRPGGSTCRR